MERCPHILSRASFRLVFVIFSPGKEEQIFPVCVCASQQGIIPSFGNNTVPSAFWA